MFFTPNPTTIEAALAPLVKAIKDLERVADACKTRSSANRAGVALLDLAIRTDQGVGNRAEAMIIKLKAITDLKE